MESQYADKSLKPDRGQVKTKKRYYFPGLDITIQADSEEEARKIASQPKE